MFLGLIRLFRPHTKRRPEKSTFPPWGRHREWSSRMRKSVPIARRFVSGPNRLALAKRIGPPKIDTHTEKAFLSI